MKRTRKNATPNVPVLDMGKAANRIEMGYIDIADIQAYEFNPRDNAAAVASVASSIKAFGFKVPIVIDGDNIIVCGHTRVEAAKTLGLTEVPYILAGDLSPAEVDAFRLIDNKVAEQARWDFDLLAGEISKLADSGLTLTDFGWTQEELDCLSDVISEDCLSAAGLVDLQAMENSQRMEKRAPNTARFVMGEFVFFIAASDYKRWADGLRAAHDYDNEDIVASIKQMLGITEVASEATRRVRGAQGSEGV